MPPNQVSTERDGFTLDSSTAIFLADLTRDPPGDEIHSRHQGLRREQSTRGEYLLAIWRSELATWRSTLLLVPLNSSLRATAKSLPRETDSVYKETQLAICMNTRVNARGDVPVDRRWSRLGRGRCISQRIFVFLCPRFVDEDDREQRDLHRYHRPAREF